MQLDCLLINPPDDPTRYPYLGILQIAGVLKDNKITVDVLDSSALGLSIEDVIREIIERKPMIIGITIMSMTLKSSYDLIREIKKLNLGITIVVGGAHVNAVPESVKDLDVEYGMHGECDFLFLDFVRILKNGEYPTQTDGLIINRDGEFIIGTPRIIQDLDSLPMPAYHLLNIDLYYSPSTSGRAISFITSRGCPYNCMFCSKLNKKRYRHMSADKIVSDIEYLITEFGIEWVEFVDEIFTLSEDNIRDLCIKILERKLNFSWGCGTRADLLDEELISLMKSAGCRKIGFGVETGVERIRELIHKKIPNKTYIDIIALCRKYGIITQTCFILGHPTETMDDMKKSIQFAKKIKSNFPRFGRMLPIPGSELFEMAKSKNEVSPDIWRQYMLGNSPLPVYTPAGVNSHKVDQLLKRSWFIYISPSNLANNLFLFINFYYLKVLIRTIRDYSFRKY